MTSNSVLANEVIELTPKISDFYKTKSTCDSETIEFNANVEDNVKSKDTSMNAQERKQESKTQSKTSSSKIFSSSFNKQDLLASKKVLMVCYLYFVIHFSSVCQKLLYIYLGWVK